MTYDMNEIDAETFCKAIELIPNTPEGQALLLALDKAAREAALVAYQRAKKQVRKEHPEYYMHLTSPE